MTSAAKVSFVSGLGCGAVGIAPLGAVEADHLAIGSVDESALDTSSSNERSRQRKAAGEIVVQKAAQEIAAGKGGESGRRGRVPYCLNHFGSPANGRHSISTVTISGANDPLCAVFLHGDAALARFAISFARCAGREVAAD
ncbi:hypothetical protein QA640_22895 [Bradyrhizobium sp. CB82]|uniref:hypothetical protein n=1 Tax=Bradyrhizobium sp. CB82 TaxID=3039159 RepID=UPI0024B1EB90|nr:hypothetical protein [Bradyrhizobium sp. CB82]WFU37343.1 hypothetical protein QA640_22895 [Bradyrhizobium sp. CB82]